MSSLYQSKWADPPSATATEEKKEEQHGEQEQKQQPPSEPRSKPEETAPEAERPEPRRKSEHTLSAAATAFAPSSTLDPPPDVSTYNEFAQTGGQEEDLFDDVVPVEESMQTRTPDDLFGDEFTPVEQPIAEKPADVPTPVVQPVVEQPSPQPVSQPSKNTNEGARGKGRGRGRGGRKDNQAQSNHTQAEQKSEEAQAPDNAPTGPKKETIASVRGDRRGTGGVRKPKLSETELAEKMAQIQIKNASLTAAHARAEADAASFAEREQQAKAKSEQRAKEERRDRQQMMGERERNRLRKLKALEGREWDMEKNEDDFSKGGKYDKRGGFAGDKGDYSDGREYLLREPREKRGGGAAGHAARGGKQTQNAPPKQEDFPSLPTKGDGTDSKPKKDLTTFPDATTAGKSWADQVESSTPSA